MKWFTLLAVLLSLTACRFRMLPGTTQTAVSGRQQISNVKAQFTAEYFSDYDFHKPTRKEYITYDPTRLKTILKKDRPAVIFAAHTFIVPFISTLALHYKSRSVGEVVSSAKKRIMNDERTQKWKQWEQTLGKRTFTVCTYSIDSLNYREFYSQTAEHVTRIAFWANAKYKQAFDHESNMVVETLK